MENIFHFKQFDVDQSGCGMKINTDGVLLGALAPAVSPGSVLDIGTGTGVIALMLAQRFGDAEIDAIEIDPEASVTAAKNFNRSAFNSRLRLFTGSFQSYYESPGDLFRQYDLIVSNPPFFLNSLKNPGRQKHTARHTDHSFFFDLVKFAVKFLNRKGKLCLILPADTAAVTVAFAGEEGLFPEDLISISSFPGMDTYRKIITFGFHREELSEKTLVIYEREKEYSGQYQEVLREFFTIFK